MTPISYYRRSGNDVKPVWQELGRSYNLDMDFSADLTAVAAQLPTRWLGRPLWYRDEVESTNDLLRQMAQAGTAVDPVSGTVLVANYQSHGRGRFARRWQAPAGSSLLFSLLLRPHWRVQRNHWLTMLGSLAVAEAITAETGLAARIKWPNDIVLAIDSVWHKVGGLLLEGEVDSHGRCPWAILGIGLNVNIGSADLPPAVTPPTSLQIVAGRPISRVALLGAVLQRLEAHYEAAQDGRSPQAAWQQLLVTLGQAVSVTEANGRLFEGTAVGVDGWGSLQVKLANGQIETVVAADVSLRQKSFDIYDE